MFIREIAWLREVVPGIWQPRSAGNMAESKSKRMPKSASLDELVKFFESHDMGEYWEQLPEAHFDIDIKKRTFLFAIDEDVAKKLTDIAKAKHVPSEALVNAWLREKVLEQTQAT